LGIDNNHISCSGQYWVRGRRPWAGLIEICVIDALSSFTVSFFDQNDIREPGGVVGFFDETCVE